MERLHIEIKPSLSFCLLCLAIHVLAIIALWLSGLSLLLSMSVGFALVVSATWHIRRYGLLADAGAIVALTVAGGSWHLKRRDGRWINADMENTVVLTAFLVVMNFHDERGNRYPVALLQDSMSREDFRQTRQRLRLTAG